MAIRQLFIRDRVYALVRGRTRKLAYALLALSALYGAVSPGVVASSRGSIAKTGRSVQTRQQGRVHDTGRPQRPPATETVDGVQYQDIPAAPSVAWVLGLTQRPGWVLAGDPLGLKLAVLYYHPAPELRSAQVFQQYRTANGQQFNISEWLVDPSEAFDPRVRVPRRALAVNAQVVTLSIAGVQTQGQYGEIPGYRSLIDTPPNATRDSGGVVQTFRAVDIDEGNLRIRLSAAGLSHDEFLSVISALLDGRTHPNVVAQLQQELDSAAPSTPH